MLMVQKEKIENTMMKMVGLVGLVVSVLRASGADADGIEKKDGKYGDEDDDGSERRCNADRRGGKPDAVT
jgi:hypothetical protein